MNEPDQILPNIQLGLAGLKHLENGLKSILAWRTGKVKAALFVSCCLQRRIMLVDQRDDNSGHNSTKRVEDPPLNPRNGHPAGIHAINDTLPACHLRRQSCDARP